MNAKKEHRLFPDGERKHCSVCDAWYPLKMFHVDRDKWDGLFAVCRSCTREKYRLSVHLKELQELRQ